MVECIRTVHLHSAAVLPDEVLWSNASAEFICTMQPLRPSKDEAQACRYGVHLHSADLLPERLGAWVSYAPSCTSLAQVSC